MKKPYLKIRAKYGKSVFHETKISIDPEENPEWWPTFTDELKLYFLDEELTSISIRRIR